MTKTQDDLSGSSALVPPSSPESRGTAPATPMLDVVGLTKAFGLTKALRGATLSVREGTIHCLLGENGAGKSTIGKIVSGLFLADAGQVLLAGEAIAPKSIAEARALGIAIVFQELSLAPHLSVVENICLGNEGRIGLTDRRAEVQSCKALLEPLGLGNIDIDGPVGKLPVAQQQLIEIAKALATNPRLIILDEPTAMLGASEKRDLFGVIRKLRSAGKTFIFVTHHLEEVIELGDSVSILRDGIVVDSFAMEKGLNTDDILSRMGTTRSAGARQVQSGTMGKSFFSASIVGRSSSISVEIGKGEIVGLYGVVGCGREELIQAVSGVAPSPSFEMTLDGAPFHPARTSIAVRRGVAYLASGRAANGILPSMSIRSNLTIGQLSRFSRAGFINGRKEKRVAEAQLALLKTRMRSADDPITSLSGGNQQKVLLGRCLETANRVLILEDPTAGIDLAAKDEIHSIIRSRASEGLAVLLMSSDLAETIALCNRVYAFFGGEIVGCYSGNLAEHEDDIVADILGSDIGNRASGTEGRP